MQFESFSEAMAMGGHGPFVWGAYAITLVVVLISLLKPWLATRRLQSAIRQRSAGQLARTKSGANAAEVDEVPDAPQT